MATEVGTRRSPAQVRALITHAARQLFETRGYDATTTREVAEHAGVIHAAVFRHFGSKEELFEEVVLGPLLDLVQQFVDRWASEETIPGPGHETQMYVGALYELVARNRTLFTMLASAPGREGTTVPARRARLALGHHLRDLERRILATSSRQATMDLALAIRFNIALVLGLVMFHETLFSADGPQLTSGALVDEVSRYVTRGAILDAEV